MKKTKTLAFISMLGFAGALASCSASSDELGKPEDNGKGQLKLNLIANADFCEQTRVLNENTYSNPDNYTVQLFNAVNSDELMNCKGSEIESNLPKELEIGSYQIKAFFGTEHAASRDEFLVEGSSTFQIIGKDEQNINLTCTPTCGKVSVNFNWDMAKYFSDYNVSFKGTKALSGNTFDWTKNDSEPWYVKLDENGENITFTINTTTKDEYGSDYNNDGSVQKNETKTGFFKLERNKAYKLNIKPNFEDSGTTGAITLDISIDENTNDIERNIEIPISWI